MKIVNISKAQRTVKALPVESVTILIEKELGSFETLEKSAEDFRSEAVKIVDALQASLPGGIFDNVASVILERKASHFRVTF